MRIGVRVLHVVVKLDGEKHEVYDGIFWEIVFLTHTSIRPIHQWDAKDGWAGPPINRANGRPIHQGAQPTHQYDGHNNILLIISYIRNY